METVEFLKVVLGNTGIVIKESDGISEVITVFSLSVFKQHLPIIVVNCAFLKSEKARVPESDPAWEIEVGKAEEDRSYSFWVPLLSQVTFITLVNS